MSPNADAPETAATRWSRLRALYRTKTSVRWTVDLTLVVAVVSAIGLFQTRAHLRGAAPSLPLTTLDGKATSLEAYHGKPTLVYLWAPWCGVCKAESQNVRWVRGLVGDRANVVSIATAYEQLDDVRAYVKDGLGYPVLVSPSADRAFRVGAFPTMFVLDAQGTIVRSAAGYTTTFGLWWRLTMP